MKWITLFLIIITLSACIIQEENPGGLLLYIILNNTDNNEHPDTVYYSISGEGPDSTYGDTKIRINKLLIQEIIPGKWKFIIKAYDAKENFIGTGSRTMTIVPDTIIETTIIVNTFPESTPESTPEPVHEPTPGPISEPTHEPTSELTPDPTPEPTPDPTIASAITPASGVQIGETHCAYLDITRRTLYNVSHTMEYSSDGKKTWTDCSGSIQQVNVCSGNKIWVRQKNDKKIEQFLGEVQTLSGPDLIPGMAAVGIGNWNDSPYGSPGESLEIRTYFTNTGDQDCTSSSLHFRYYLSKDTIITQSDILLVDYIRTPLCSAGETHFTGTNFIVPNVASGIYYVGCILDATDVIEETNEDNNTTRPCDVAGFFVKNPSTVPEGAFKIVNSWGTGGWENKSDGHYWITYRTMKKQEMKIVYYFNNYNEVYTPTIIAVFKITHPYRDECWITLGIGDPEHPYMEKDLNSRWGTSLQSGHTSFPDNNIAVDISEFSSAINDLNLYLKVKNSGTSPGKIHNFSVEFYSDYKTFPFKIRTGSSCTFPGSALTSVTIPTQGALTDTEIEIIQPVSRTFGNKPVFIEEKPDRAELMRDMASAGVYDPDTTYKVIVKGKYATGEVPLTAADWEKVLKLRDIESPMTRTGLPLSIDHSRTQFFPPIGNQGTEGSCAAFSLGYYIQSFTEAKEHGWDLSTTSWTRIDPHLQSIGGAPGSNRDKIFSPDFIYHQINSGVDEGANAQLAAALIIRIGNCSWAQMPYNTTNHSKWPKETAWREAGQYRGYKVGNHYWDYHQNGYFIIYDDSDIDLLKRLLASGFCVSTSVKGDVDGIYDLLDSQDVVDNVTIPKMSVNHANTIVGYKEGSVWDSSNPDK
ncbi:MAG: hypothetical protein JXJ04_24085 [Spirochaetales bacterium]|nr:hypothetical protein [Spirochaetales bacterium]